jgi:glutamate-5-semialdehyde dehydrogenase
MDLKSYIQDVGKRARLASTQMVALDSATKASALLSMADAVVANAEAIKRENAKDLEAGRADGLSSAMLDRLALDDERIEKIRQAVREIAAQTDPVGEVSDMNRRPSGIEVGKMRVPIGVIGIIYESRPNVTADAGALCLKAGNACILRGGKEAYHSNMILGKVLSEAGTAAGLPEHAIQVIKVTDRETVTLLAQSNDYVDVIIPRGGEGLIRAVVDAATIPVIKHYNGICHTYVDEAANIDMAVDISYNAKVQRPGVCNAMETLLIHESVAAELIPPLFKKYREAGVELRCDDAARAIDADVIPVTEEDWGTEYIDLILSVRIVKDLSQAMDHIREYGSAHTDAIVTDNIHAARRFVREVDSSSVMVNASTRFSDGGEYGLGAEIGISTDKLHARGPMGATELTTYKWVVYGDGTIRA